ncbi:nicotinate-nucleotide-dimethylbenzimidazole phosphoribosyltransferase [Halalkalibacter wakoensis JCM 9140]|uniref:Nicotinate-nucleotide-dimethylbenzimidazole phosphoribosyltransferase n=1 Tax=Halalkalibacter wakoensis JCM 9140 TaxID=1236970 RepID=W4PZV3_9BACI|nr:nicotinate-nucleotide-dimethylbenzimidazole phosphoribosyltransferase [Halalkalibacter wakoensis JCM 9140]
MSRDEAKAAIEVGYVQAKDMIQKGINCLILGEMGIGNTTSSSAIVSFLGDEEVDAVVGMGTGISSEQLQHKGNIIKQAIEKRNPNSEDPIDVLSKIGGLEIAGMAGAMIAAAENRTPILVDGFICTTAVLVAKELAPHVVDYIILAHKSSEPGHAIATSLLKKKPLIDLHLRLGEGTGAAIAYPIVQSATLMLKEMATFTSAGVSTKT